MNSTLMLALTSISLGAVGQFMLKVGVNRAGGFSFRRGELLSVALRIATQPHIMIGLFLFVSSMVMWLGVLSKMDVSRAYPMVSLSYVLVAVLAKVMLGETISLTRAIAIAVILLGVTLINLS